MSSSHRLFRPSNLPHRRIFTARGLALGTASGCWLPADEPHAIDEYTLGETYLARRETRGYQHGAKARGKPHLARTRQCAIPCQILCSFLVMITGAVSWKRPQETIKS